MTCIVGYIDLVGTVWMGADTSGANDNYQSHRTDPKVFFLGPYLIGFTSSFRMGQLLRYKLEVGDQPEGQDDSEHMCTTFIDAVRQCFKDGGFARKEDEREDGGEFLVAYRGQLYTIYGDYQVGKTADRWAAVGAGQPYALGAMVAIDSLMNSRDGGGIVTLALSAAARYSPWVRGPYVIEEMDE